MKIVCIALISLLIPMASVIGLSQPKLVVKSRSVNEVESTIGVKVHVPVVKPQHNGAAVAGQLKDVKQPRPFLATFIKDDTRDYDEEYWYHPQIHTLGNTGIFGAIHAALAPLSSHVIDNVAYNGVDIRLKVAQELRKLVTKGASDVRVLDMCCGVGMSTRALCKAFPDAQTVIGLDTSPHMVAMANFLTNHLSIVRPWFQQIKRRFYVTTRLLGEQGGKVNALTRSFFLGLQFKKANAQDTHLPDESFDLVTVMYAFHEAPMKGREHIIKEARRLLAPGGILAIVDIASDYEPSPNMLAGEPYVIEYQQNMSNQLRRMKGFLHPEYKTLVPGHVGMWTLRRSPNAV